MIADALEVLCTKQEVGGLSCPTSVAFDHAKRIGKEFGVEFVQLYVALANFEGRLRIPVIIGLQDLRELMRGHCRHGVHTDGEVIWEGVWTQRFGALGDVLCKIADALKLRRDPERANDFAQINRHGLTARDQGHRFFLNLCVKQIDCVILKDREAG
nr:hypothetical protein [Hyphomicrobium sp.]